VGAFVYGDFGADFYSNGIGAMEEYIKEKPDVTRNFVQATMRGLKFTLDHPKEAVGMLKKHQPQLDEDVALQEVEILRNITNSKNLKVLGSMTKEKMQETQDLMIKYMDLKNPVPLDQAYTNEFLT
jgi:NitT/TauT family transport system substrate-binding protein